MSRLRANFVVNKDANGPFEASEGINITAAKNIKFQSGSSITDSNDNEYVKFSAVVSGAVNEITVSNAVTSGSPSISATGNDTNISLDLISKGSGTVRANGVEVVTLTGSQTLTNKTLSSPTLNTPTIVTPTISGSTTISGTTRFIGGNVGVGTTDLTEALSVYPKIQILNDSGSNGRLILRAKPGNLYRWNIDNDGSTNNLRFFREDDATAANGTVPLSITTTGNATLSGNLNAAGNYYVKLARTTNQTITTVTDTLVGFSVRNDPNSWFNSGNNRIIPTVAGNYFVTAMVNWAAGATTNTVQSNIQIRRNGTTVALSQLGVQTHPYTMNISAIVTLNGSTDYIEFTVYTGNATSQVVTGDASGTLTKLELYKIN